MSNFAYNARMSYVYCMGHFRMLLERGSVGLYLSGMFLECWAPPLPFPVQLGSSAISNFAPTCAGGGSGAGIPGTPNGCGGAFHGSATFRSRAASNPGPRYAAACGRADKLPAQL